MAGAEGLEPATSGFGDRRSSQLSYTPAVRLRFPPVGKSKTRAGGVKKRSHLQSQEGCTIRTIIAVKACGKLPVLATRCPMACGRSIVVMQ